MNKNTRWFDSNPDSWPPKSRSSVCGRQKAEEPPVSTVRSKKERIRGSSVRCNHVHPDPKRVSRRWVLSHYNNSWLVAGRSQRIAHRKHLAAGGMVNGQQFGAGLRRPSPPIAPPPGNAHSYEPSRGQSCCDSILHVTRAAPLGVLRDKSSPQSRPSPQY